MRPAIHSTNDPPFPIQDPLLAAYINDLRRRIEVQNDLAAALAQEIQTLKEELEGKYHQENYGGTE